MQTSPHCANAASVLPPFETFVKIPLNQPEEISNIFVWEGYPAPAPACSPTITMMTNVCPFKDPDSLNLNSASTLPNPTNEGIFGDSALLTRSESELSMTHQHSYNFLQDPKDAMKTNPTPKRRRGTKRTPFMYQSQDVSDLRVSRSKKQKGYREKQKEERDQLEKSRHSFIKRCQQLIKIVQAKEETINNLKNENTTLTAKNKEMEEKLQIFENKGKFLVDQQKALPTPMQTVTILDLLCGTIRQLPKHCEVYFGPTLSEMRVQPLANNDVQEIRAVLRQTERASGLPLVRMMVKLDCEINGESKDDSINQISSVSTQSTRSNTAMDTSEPYIPNCDFTSSTKDSQITDIPPNIANNAGEPTKPGKRRKGKRKSKMYESDLKNDPRVQRAIRAKKHRESKKLMNRNSRRKLQY
ncbi:unnamed protein product [Orchesella dallaii]|uniref:BZIP domain-containing protein n=1 Tax=Orchesella dallaii TaxID=48710 RepID=A0ABP1RIV6_9HEXA